MITTDMPIYTGEGGIARLSGVSSSILSRFKATPTDPNPDMYMLKTASLGSIILSGDARILGGNAVLNCRLGDTLTSRPELEFGNKKIPAKLMKLMEEEAFSGVTCWSQTPNVTPYVYKLLSLTEQETKVALRYLKKMYVYGVNSDNIYIKGRGHTLLARTMQVLGWKLGVHSRYEYRNSGSSLLFKKDCEFTEIDYEKSSVTSQIVEMKLIRNFSRGTQCYILTSNDLPVIPTVAGTFSF
jgi:hypothetical protein